MDLDESTSFLDHTYWDAPNVNANEKYREMFESRISVVATEKLPGGRNLTRKPWRGPTIRKDMLKKCLEGFRELAKEKTEQLHKVSSPCLDDHQIQKEELEPVGELPQVCSKIGEQKDRATV